MAKVSEKSVTPSISRYIFTEASMDGVATPTWFRFPIMGGGIGRQAHMKNPRREGGAPRADHYCGATVAAGNENRPRRFVKGKDRRRFPAQDAGAGAARGGAAA